MIATIISDKGDVEKYWHRVLKLLFDKAIDFMLS